MSFLLVLLVLGAVWRLARLVAIDFITEPARLWVDRRSTWLGYLVSCPWCISVWIAPLVAWPALWWPDNRVIWLVLLSLTASGVAGLTTTVEGVMDAYTEAQEDGE